METSIQEITEKIKGESAFIADVYKELDKVIIGQRHVTERILISIFSNGHVLLEGVPGLAKTLIISTLSRIIDCTFKRVQFTPDLLPADIIGTTIYNPKTMEFSQRKGPVFHNIILGDEINRAPAKVQSALLEAMQERQVTIGENTYPLPQPFMVLATQNPIEQEGTYPLPEAQVDRFFMKIKIDYPDLKEEKIIMDSQQALQSADVKKVITADAIARVQRIINTIYVDDKAKDYILQIISATRNPEKYNLDLKNMIAFGASPRASISLFQAAKAHAFMQNKGFVSPEDIKSIVMDVLRHRVAISYQAEAEGLASEDVIQKILDELVVP